MHRVQATGSAPGRRRPAPPRARHLGIGLVVLAVLVAGTSMTSTPATAGHAGASVGHAGASVGHPAPLRVAQGSSTVSVSGATVTVEVFGIPGHQVRAQLADGSIVSTALITEAGQTQMVFDLGPGSYEVEVITFDPAGTPTSVGRSTVSISGPPPTPPTVAVTGGSTTDHRSVFDIDGTPGDEWEVQVVRESRVRTTKSGDIGEDGTARAVFLLESGPWGYFVTLENSNGTSEATLGEFDVEIGTPEPPTLRRDSEDGANVAIISVQGPRGGRAEVTATTEDGRTLAATTQINLTGNGAVEIELDREGPWTATAVAIDFTGQRSDTATLDGAFSARLEGPPLEVSRLGSSDGEFAFRITTDIGVEVSITSGTPGLEQSFVTTEEQTEIRQAVPDGVHLIEVTATDEVGNVTSAVLSSASSEGGTSWVPLLLIVLGMLAAFGVLALVKRQELMDWWNSREYR